MAQKYVAYYRVSTHRQGKSGLGLEAQRVAVVQFTRGKGTVIAEFTEIETGKQDERPELQKAIAHSKAKGAKLVIAKLDRLSRNAAFIFTLRDSGVDFVACDLPDANTVTIGIFASIAQHEREIISQRTKVALEAKKAQGFKLGKPDNLNEQARRRSIEVRQAKAGQKWRYSQERVKAMEMQRAGDSLRKIAMALNLGGYRTSTGKLFRATTVKRLLS